MSNNRVVIRSKQDVINYVNARPSHNRTLLLVFIALGGIFIDAYDLVVLGLAANQLQEQFNLTPLHLSLIMTSMPVGALIGALVGGIYTDKFGRKLLFTIDLILLVCATILTALAPNATWLLIFRFLMGVGIGLDMPVALSFIAELSNSKTKGRNVNYWQVFWYIATVTTSLIVLLLYLLQLGDNVWRWSIGLGAVFALIILALRFKYLNESPMWAAHNMSLREAAHVLERSYQVEVDLEADDDSCTGPARKINVPLLTIFNSRYRKRTILAMVIAATQAMEYYAIGFYIPVILSVALAESRTSVLLGTAAINVFGIVGGLAGAHLTQKFGMRKLAISGYVVVIVSLVAISISFDSISIWLSAGVIAVFIMGHSSGPGTQGKTIGALSYPTSLRGYGTGAVEAASRVGGILGTFLFPVLIAAFLVSGAMLFIAIAPALGLLTALLIRWDPTYRGDEIEAEEQYLAK